MDRDASGLTHNVRSCEAWQEWKPAKVWFFKAILPERGQIAEVATFADLHILFTDFAVEIAGMFCLGYLDVKGTIYQGLVYDMSRCPNSF